MGEKENKMPKSTTWWVQFKDKSVAGPTIFEEEISEKEFKEYIKKSNNFTKMPAGTKVHTKEPTS